MGNMIEWRYRLLLMGLLLSVSIWRFLIGTARRFTLALPFLGAYYLRFPSMNSLMASSAVKLTNIC